MDSVHRQDRPHQRRRHDPEGQPVRRQGGRAPGDLVDRPPQRPGGDAAIRRPASCGKSSTARAAATRSTSRARARTTAGRRSRTASNTRARRSPAASPPKEGMEQPLYYWDPVIAPSGMVFYTGNLFPAWKGSLFIGGMVTTNLVRLDVKGDEGRRRGAAAEGPAAEPRAHPRRAAGPRRRDLPAHRQRQGTHPEAGAEEVAACSATRSVEGVEDDAKDRRIGTRRIRRSKGQTGKDPSTFEFFENRSEAPSTAFATFASFE